MPRCPSCRTPMTRVETDGLQKCTCSNCFGTWINTSALLRYTRREAQEAAENPGESDSTSLADLAAVVVESNTTAELRCPDCQRPMEKEKWHPMIPVEVDKCQRCRGVWLDVGELPLLRRLFEELQNSEDPEVVRLREKIARVHVQVEQRRGRPAPEPVATTGSGMDGWDWGLVTLDVVRTVLRL